MILIKSSPKNKEYFIKVKKFAKEVIKICKKLKVTPIVWGGLAYFGYTKDKGVILHDIDFLIPDRYLKKIIEILEKRKLRYHWNAEWHELRIYKKGLRVEFDPIEDYKNKDKNFKDFGFNGLKVKVVSLNSLIKAYKRASEVSHDKPEQHRKRYEALLKAKKTGSCF
jgi:hypothetical protein